MFSKSAFSPYAYFFTLKNRFLHKTHLKIDSITMNTIIIKSRSAKFDKIILAVFNKISTD